MRKVFLVLVLITFMVLPVASTLAVGEKSGEMTEEKIMAVKENCDGVRAKLRSVQKEDAKVRVYLGRYYEEIFKDFITPFNIRLIENSLSGAEMVENQNELTGVRELFGQDFVNYQKGLEELIAMDCKVEPKRFYEKLELVRQRRKVMDQDVLRMRSLISGHLKLVEQVKGKMK